MDTNADESASEIADAQKCDELQVQVHGVRNVVEELVKVSLEVSYHWSKVAIILSLSAFIRVENIS
jgi:hypothetical protein